MLHVRICSAACEKADGPLQREDPSQRGLTGELYPGGLFEACVSRDGEEGDRDEATHPVGEGALPRLCEGRTAPYQNCALACARWRTSTHACIHAHFLNASF